MAIGFHRGRGLTKITGIFIRNVLQGELEDQVGRLPGHFLVLSIKEKPNSLQ